MIKPVQLCRAAVLAALCLSFGTGPAAAADDPIRIAFPSGMNGQIVVTMEKAGIAKEAGLDATFAAFQYGPPMMEALAAGSIDAVVTSLMPVTSYAAKLPGDVKIVAMLGQSSHSLMVAKDSPVTAPAALAGRKVGVSFGSDSHLDTLVWLKETGLADKVSLINIAPSELVTALANASVDAVVIRQPQVLRLQQQSGARILHTWPFRFVSIVKSKYIQDNPKALEKYLAALRSAIFYISQHHEQAATWFGASLRIAPEIVMEVSKDDPNYAAKSLSDIDIQVTPASRALIEKWATDAYDYKMIRSKVDFGQLFR
ncbi:ABC transporter substrate-binding protein [Aquabacter spiritensis]|uniref:ABC-type nitrate/sulfonate/bicarbonate transport system substrate-binding protein n=1 Tax=Aquabacter spiritensis TaxID=933073 RepID=A0A4R3LX01_9HYPH|nr:NrtA/SsuA/CpmA family ABC transporter substrate-binding protein [Aquabacter spiritensis]TCT05154.1 ABC-type nitrate/sulfonate/bicarbonate transport system substrate-binding protein [Aquabacter spiritensis]